MEENKISTCIITYNEEANIEDCIRSVLPFSDEVVVVDSLSEDATVDIAKRFTDKVFLQPFLGHVAQKNLALSKATCPWVFAIDADERVSGVLSQEIIKAKRSGFYGLDGFYVRRVSCYLGRWMRRGLWSSDWKLRLFRRDIGKWGGKDPHDRVELPPGSRVGRFRGELSHVVYRDLSHHLDTINRYTTTIASQKEMSKARTVLYMVFSPVLMFFKGYFLKLGFLEGVPGFIQAVTGAFYSFMKYAKLYERKLEGQ